MNLLRAAEFKVGVMVLGVAVLLAYMSMQVTEGPYFFARTQNAWFLLPDAAGLVKGGHIKSAGITVGTIKDIKLQDSMARVDLALRPDVKLYVSASVEVKSQGILGDRFIDIKMGSPTDPPLGPDGQILDVRMKGSLDNLVGQIGDISNNFSAVAKTLREAVSGEGNRNHVLGRIALNIEKLTGDLAELSSGNKGKVGAIIDQVNKISKTMDEVLNDPTDEGFRSTWKRSLARLDSTLKNVDEISGKVNKGEGTVGRLINDEETVEELNTAIQGVNNFLDTAGKTQTSLDFNSTYLGAVGQNKTHVSVLLQPGLDRYYLLGFVDDPAGSVEKTETSTTSAGTTTNVSETKTFRNKMKFNAQFAKNFYNFTVRAGLFENAGGVGFDYKLAQERLRLTLEAFEFTNLNLRAQAQYNFYKGIYVLGGMQDILDRGSKRSVFFGAGLILTNDDLKVLISSGGLPVSR